MKMRIAIFVLVLFTGFVSKAESGGAIAAQKRKAAMHQAVQQGQGPHINMQMNVTPTGPLQLHGQTGPSTGAINVTGPAASAPAPEDAPPVQQPSVKAQVLSSGPLPSPCGCRAR